MKLVVVSWAKIFQRKTQTT